MVNWLIVTIFKRSYNTAIKCLKNFVSQRNNFERLPLEIFVTYRGSHIRMSHLVKGWHTLEWPNLYNFASKVGHLNVCQPITQCGTPMWHSNVGPPYFLSQHISSIRYTYWLFRNVDGWIVSDEISSVGLSTHMRIDSIANVSYSIGTLSNRSNFRTNHYVN